VNSLSRREVIRGLLVALVAPSTAWAQDWKPAVLSVEQTRTLTSLSELLIPGSTQANVVPLLDLLLTVDEPSHRERLSSALGMFDEEAVRRFGKRCHDLSTPQCDQLLAAANGAPESNALRIAFETLKKSIVEVYYSTETGMTELGWTHNRFFVEYPACQRG
jgi:hypothetical protein